MIVSKHKYPLSSDWDSIKRDLKLRSNELHIFNIDGSFDIVYSKYSDFPIDDSKRVVKSTSNTIHITSRSCNMDDVIRVTRVISDLGYDFNINYSLGDDGLFYHISIEPPSDSNVDKVINNISTSLRS